MATANPQDFIRIGYKNGQIPLCALVDVPGQPGVKLHPAATEQMQKLLIAAQKDGIRFRISNGYRDYDTQVDVKVVQGRGAATPGQSKHGWGTTIDIGDLYQLSLTTANEMNRTLPAGRKVDRFSPAVHKRIRETNQLYRWLAANAPKYGWVNPEWAKTESPSATVNECWHWEFQIWPTIPSTVQFKPTTKPVTLRCGEDTPIRSQSTRPPAGPSAPESTVTPYIGSLESFHPRIQYELTRRRVSAETANTYMPFVKLTSLTNVLGNNIPGGASGSIGDAWCPTLGPHGEDNVSFENIYLAKNNINDINLPQSNRSIIGYATTLAALQTSDQPTYSRIPIIVEETAVNTDQSNIPMPGIVEVSAEKSTAGPLGVRGGLMKVDMKIIAYSVGQVDALLRYFLRPATRVVLEWGRKSSNTSEPLNPYNWNRSAEFISNEFSQLITDVPSQRKFIKDYIYANNGNYEIFIGYVVKFDLKYNKNNTYEISLTVHSVQQFEIPTRHTGVKSLCADSIDKCAAMDVQEYFAEEYSWKQRTFKKLMTREENAVQDAKKNNTPYSWSNHFIPLRNTTTDNVGGGSNEAGTKENEYLVSWRFFVDKILNDNELGIISLITDQKTKDFIKIGLLKSVATETEVETKNSTNKLIANQVGWHPALRSTNPNVLVIYNEAAQSTRSPSEQQNYQNLIDAAITVEEERVNFRQNVGVEQAIKDSNIGSFKNRAGNTQTQSAAGRLTEGVWINTEAIKQAFTSNDTVSSAINALLMMMNGATEGYWNLQLYSSDRPNPGMFVIDWGLSKPLVNNTDNTQFPWIDKEESETTNVLNSINKIDIVRYQKSNEGDGQDEPKYIYMFNRGTKRFNDGELGSDILDLNVEFNLPQVVAVQAIAGVGGPAQKSTLQSIDIPQLNKITLIKDIFPSCDTTNICTNQECSDKDLQDLRATWDAARQNTQLAQQQATAARGYASYGDGPSSRFNLAENIMAEGAAGAETAAQNKYNTALTQRTYGNTMVIDTVRELSSLGTLLNYIEFNPASMMKKLNRDSRTSESGQATPYAHAFNSSNLTKTIVNVTLPGIGGIELFQSFLVDRVPSILERGFYVVTKIIHKFSSDRGWLTTIEGRFRYRPENENKGSGYPECIDGEPLDLRNLTAAERDAYRRGGLERLQELRTRGY